LEYCEGGQHHVFFRLRVFHLPLQNDAPLSSCWQLS
jgi:hypothetical protein